MKFRAAVLHAAGRPLSIEQIELPALQPGDVLVRVRAAGICHTDVELASGALTRPLPIVPGHEAAGTVEAVGGAVTRVKPGDRVVCSWNPSCGHCFYCEDGLPILCEPIARHQPQGLLPDGLVRMYLPGGKPLRQFMTVSAHAEYCVVPEAGAVVVPDAIPFDRACLLGCGVATGFGAVTRTAPVSYGSNVLVVGCGAIGLSVIQAASLRRPARVIALDLDAARLAQARLFGATDLIESGDDAAAAVKALTSGRGADFSFEAAGSQAAMRIAVEAARPGGQIVLLGKVPLHQDVAFRWSSLTGEKRLMRSSYGGAKPHRDFALLAQAYLDGALKLDELITERLSLDDINAGYAAVKEGRAIRSVVMFDD